MCLEMRYAAEVRDVASIVLSIRVFAASGALAWQELIVVGRAEGKGAVANI